MMRFSKFVAEAKQYKKLSRAEFETRLRAGHKFTKAGLYEPEQAPKGTEFVHVNLGPTSTFMRARPSDHPVGPGVFHKGMLNDG